MNFPRFRTKRYYKKIPPIYLIERESGTLIKELIPAEQWLKWLYYTPFGNLALESIVKRKAVSGLYGRYMKTAHSASKIKSFIEIFNIDMSEYEKSNPENYNSFNDFFIRKIKPQLRPIEQNPNVVVSPADGKILAYANLDVDMHFVVKGYDFSIYEFLDNKELADNYINGSMLIIRLAPSDYHRFHFPFDTTPSDSHFIKGKYYSVSPHSIKRKIKTFYQNRREYTILQSKRFGEVIMAEVGATLVGCIKQNYEPFKKAKKGDEKGYFEFGGSSIILLFKKETIRIDADILHNTQHLLALRPLFQVSLLTPYFKAGNSVQNYFLFLQKDSRVANG